MTEFVAEFKARISFQVRDDNVGIVITADNAEGGIYLSRLYDVVEESESKDIEFSGFGTAGVPEVDYPMSLIVDCTPSRKKGKAALKRISGRKMPGYLKEGSGKKR